MNRIYYIMGKSSSGKDTLYRKLLARTGLLPLILYTTRPKRENECSGREYYFTDRAAFDRMEADGSLIEARVYQTVYGEWIYFTAADSIDLTKGSYLGIGTLESFCRLKEYFGSGKIVPLYIDVEDGIRLTRALEREKLEETPKYAELCRRFLADSEDFSEEKLQNAGIRRVFDNNGSPEKCLAECETYIRTMEDTEGCPR